MWYLSGIHALNLPCELETCGDWHKSGLQWQKLSLLDSNDSLFGEYGIEREKAVPQHTELYHVANHIRALLDLLAQGNYSAAQGMKNDFICNDKYTEDIFHKVFLLKETDNWNEIDNFMGREYLMQWIKFKQEEAL